MLQVPDGSDTAPVEPQAPQQPQDPPAWGQEFTAARNRLRSQREAEVLNSFEVAVRSDPDRRAEAQQLAAELGTDPDHAERNLDVMRESLRRKQVKEMNLSATNPVLASRMREIEFARISHKDVENLSFFEQMGRNWDAGLLEVEVGELENQVARGTITPTDRETLAQKRARLDAIGSSSGFWTGAARTVGQMLRAIPDAAVAGSAGALAVGVAGQMGPQAFFPEELITMPTAFAIGFGARLFQRSTQIERGHSYRELYELTKDHDLSSRVSLGVGLVNGALEATGTGFLARGFGLLPLQAAIRSKVAEKVAQGITRPIATKAATEFAKRYAEGFAGEWATEIVQQVVQQGGREIARAEQVGDTPFIRRTTPEEQAALVEELADTALQAAYGVGLIAGIGPVAAHFRDQRRAQAAQEVQQEIGKFLDAAVASPVLERSPVAFESYLADVTRGTAIETLHIEAERVGEALRQAEVTQEQLATTLPDLAAQLERAIRDKDDVVVQTSEYAAKIAGALPKLDAALRPHLRTDALEMSPAEAEAVLQRQASQTTQKLAKPKVEDAGQDEGDALTAEDEARAVEDDLRKQLRETGKFSDRNARKAASLYRAFVQVFTSKTGESPAQFAAEKGLTVEAAKRPSKEAVRQGGHGEEQPGLLRRIGRKLLGRGKQDDETLQQPGKEGDGKRPPRGQFDPQRLRISLFEGQDLSTFLHELGHYFLTVLGRTAASTDAPALVRQHMEDFLAWRGIESIEAWNAMSLEQQRRHHEAFAYSFEIYLFEGKAPTPELHPLFRTFKAWIRSVYRAVRDELSILFRLETGEELPVLSPEVRSVFDRLLASEDAVLRAAGARKRAGIDSESDAAFLQMEQDAIEEAVGEVERKVLGTLRGLEGAKNKRLREMQAEAKEVRAEVKRKMAAEVAEQPVYRAMRWLKSGRLEEGQDPDTNHRLRRDLVEAMGIKDVPEHYLSAEGVPPDIVAEQLGFDSGEAMVRALVSAPPLKDAIEAATDHRMMTEHTELADEREMRRVVAEALANDVKADMVARDLRNVAQLTESSREIVAAAKVQAQEILGRTPVGRVDPGHFAAQEERAAARVEEAMAAGDAMAVIAAKREQLVKMQLVKLSAKAQRQVDKTVRGFDRLWQNDEKLAKTRNMDVVNAARAILAVHGLSTGKGGQRALVWIEQLRAYDPETAADLEPVVARASDGAKDYRKLSHDDFQALAATIDELWFRSKRSREIEVGGKRMLREEAVRELVAVMKERIDGDPVGAKEAITRVQSAGLTLLGIRAAGTQLEHALRYLDGGKEGPFTRFLWNEPRAAYDRYMRAKNDAVKKLHAIVRSLDLGGGKIAAPELDYTFKNRAELFGALQHIGNDGNLRRLVVAGRGIEGRWGEGFEDGTFDASKWWSFFDRATQPGGPITNEMMDAVQAVWDLNESIKADLQKVHHALFGTYFEEVEAKPIVTRWGKYRGGYVPAKVDTRLAPEVERRKIAAETIEQKVREAMPSAPRGFTKSRVQNYARPLLLDAGQQVAHLDEVLRFLHVEGALRDVRSIVTNGEFRAVADRMDPTLVNRVLLEAYERLATNRISKAGQYPWLDRMFRFLRESSGLAILGGSLKNAMQQVTGVSNAALYVKSRHLGAAAWRYLWSPLESSRQIAGSEKHGVKPRSEYMALRLKDQVGQLLDELEDGLKPSGWVAAQKWTRRHGYFLQRFFQHHVDVVTWMGAYDQAAAEHPGDSAAAVRAADAAVRLSQGDRTPLGIASYEASTPLARLFTQFTGYANTLANQLGYAANGRERARAVFLSLLIPTALAGAITLMFTPMDWDDEDEDGVLPEWAEWFLAQQGKAVLAMLPGAGSALLSMAQSDGNRVSVSPAIETARATYRGLALLLDRTVGDREELSARNWRDILTAASVLSGFPVAAFARPGFDFVPRER